MLLKHKVHDGMTVIQSMNSKRLKVERLRMIVSTVGGRMATALVLILVISVAIVWASNLPHSLEGVNLASTVSCQFQKASQPLHVAFCDDFSQPMPTANNRSGDLNAQVWGVSRIVAGGGDNYSTGTNPSQGQVDTIAPVALQKCGTTQKVYPDNDVQICGHQLVEGVNDDGGQTVLAMYPKQPFDIAGRTGTVTFDVSADSEGPHAAWPTFVYTDQPVPAPYSSASGIETSARNSFGFTLDETCGNGAWCAGDCNWQGPAATRVGSMFITRNYQLSNLDFDVTGCVAQPKSPTQLNHFEVRLSQSQVQVWASDPGSNTLKEIAVASNVNLPLTRGLVWMEDVHYNADKFNNQQSHTFGWSNLGFDGPVLPRDLAFDVPENKTMNVDSRWPGHPGMQLGWTADNTTVQVPGVYNVNKASAGIVTFNWMPTSPHVPSISVNDHPAISTPWPFNGDTYMWRTIAIPVPLSEVKVGTNTITFNDPDGPAFANVDLIMVGAGGVPSCFDPSNCAGSPVSGTYVSVVGSGSSSTPPSGNSGSSNGNTGGSTNSGGHSSGGNGSGNGNTNSGSSNTHGVNLDAMPVPTAAFYGIKTIATVADTGDTNCVNGSRINTGDAAAKLKSISVYVPQVEASPNNQYSLAIYTSDTDNHPLKLVAQSATSTLTPMSWNTLPVTANLAPHTYYWLMYFTNGENNTPYNNTINNQGAWACPGDFNNGTFPASLDGMYTKGQWQYSIYATVQ